MSESIIVDFDWRLLEISEEIEILHENFKNIKKLINDLQFLEEREFQSRAKAENLNPDDPEWTVLGQEVDYKYNCIIPRYYWGTFLVSLYAVFEIGIIEIANEIQKAKNLKIAIDDIKGNFLDRSKKYYEHILEFDLYQNNSDWEQINHLKHVRHAFAHTNGRANMLKTSIRKNISILENQTNGIIIWFDYIIPNYKFVENSYIAVKNILDDLIKLYKDSIN